MIDETGIVTGFTVTPASTGEREAACDLTDSISGWLLGDKGYLGGEFKEEMEQNNIAVITLLHT